MVTVCSVILAISYMAWISNTYSCGLTLQQVIQKCKTLQTALDRKRQLFYSYEASTACKESGVHKSVELQATSQDLLGVPVYVALLNTKGIYCWNMISLSLVRWLLKSQSIEWVYPFIHLPYTARWNTTEQHAQSLCLWQYYTNISRQSRITTTAGYHHRSLTTIDP